MGVVESLWREFQGEKDSSKQTPGHSGNLVRIHSPSFSPPIFIPRCYVPEVRHLTHLLPQGLKHPPKALAIRFSATHALVRRGPRPIQLARYSTPVEPPRVCLNQIHYSLAHFRHRRFTRFASLGGVGLSRQSVASPLEHWSSPERVSTMLLIRNALQDPNFPMTRRRRPWLSSEVVGVRRVSSTNSTQQTSTS